MGIAFSMSFIRTKVKKDGSEYRYLVENYRVDGKVRQRVLEYLGPVYPERKSRKRYDVRYLVMTGGSFLEERKLPPSIRDQVHPESLAWHDPRTGETIVCLDRVYLHLRAAERFFKDKLNEKQLIRAIVVLDIHESLHHVIYFQDDKRAKKEHRAIGALLGPIDDFASAGCYGLFPEEG